MNEWIKGLDRGIWDIRDGEYEAGNRMVMGNRTGSDGKGKGRQGVGGGRYSHPPFFGNRIVLYEYCSRSFDLVSFFHRGIRHIVHSVNA